MLTTIVLIVIVWMLIYLWYVIWDAHARNQFFEEKKEILKEKDWWIDKFNDCSEDLKKVKNELKDATCRNNDLWKQNSCLINENDALTNKLTQYTLRYGEIKQTIEMEHQEEIIQYYNEWLSYKEIAKKIGCGASTIQRAIKKRGLVR
jgi:predicted nuclease with TOPRIM domain